MSRAFWDTITGSEFECEVYGWFEVWRGWEDGFYT
jgi:hypothetical protein